ncbi:MAG: glycoside hydrolase family 32 protein [Propionibacteriaceae bacterium]|nr:glycoside hydrolase family 32 protein [Propionibacteriaceae bacterium]
MEAFLNSHHAKPRGQTIRTVVTAIAVSALVAAAGVVNPAGSHAAEDTTYRAQYHFTVPDHWKNDPQRPVYVNGQFNYYYLYNSQYDANPSSNYGTAWRLATSPDGVVFADQGVAAEKGTNPNYDLWSGSAVVDHHNTAGFGAGAVIMLVTQMDHPTAEQRANASGPQAQFLWYSVDGGRNFQPYGEDPVIQNPGWRDFRDPKIVWDADRDQWVTLIAEGTQVGFYTSQNLKEWTRVWQYVNTGIGTIECPDLFQIRADDGTIKWIFGVSANGYATNDPATYAYWTGSFDGAVFHADEAAPQWLDHGFDWYGAVTWEDPTAPLDQRYAVGWMNFWDYPHNTPTWEHDGFNGTDSITRQINLRRFDDGYRLVSRPVDALDSIATSTRNLGSFTVDGLMPLDVEGDAYRLEARVDHRTASNVGFQLRRSADGARHADVGVTRDYSYLNRGATGNPGTSWKLESKAPYDSSNGEVDLTILVDRTTIEVFVDDGRYVHSSQVFADPTDLGLALYTVDGPAVFHDVTVTEFANVAQRPARLLASFEGDTWGEGWTATGASARQGPSSSALTGQVGAKVADTFVGGGDPATGIITSPAFVIDRDYLHFQIAGGRHPLGVEPATSVQLLIDGHPVRTETGDDSGVMRHVAWDVSEYAGQVAEFQILDDATGAWGHLMVDQVILSD